MIAELLLAVLVALVSRRLLLRWRRMKIINKIPGAPTVPLLGNAREFFGSANRAFVNMQKLMTYGEGILRLHMGPIPFVVLYRAHTIEALLGGSSPLTKGSAYNLMKPFLGTGLISSEGAKWKSRRRLLTPAFHFKILDDFNRVYNKQARVLVAKLEGAALSGAALNIHDRLSLCTLDTIMESSMGWELNSQEDTKCQYLDNVKKFEALVQVRQTRPWLRPEAAWQLLGYGRLQQRLLQVLHGQSEAAIRRRKQALEKQASGDELGDGDAEAAPKKRRVFLDLMLEEAARTDVQMSDADLREEVDTIMFAGHDTTSAATAFALHFLAAHPRVQQRAYEEIMEVVGEEETVTPFHLKELKYLDACMRESMRIATPVPYIGREAGADLVIDGYTVPAGTPILVNIYALHRDPQHFPSPETYDPERFLGDHGRPPYAYIPFSIGARNCIGQRFAVLLQKVLLCHILRRYTIRTEQTYEDLTLVRQTVLVASKGVMITLQRR